MLKRFKKIKNVGKFSDIDISGKSFAAKTVIFGNNGNGKSTLTAILRSLETNQPKLLKERKTFGSAPDQKVELVFGDDDVNQEITYQNGVWNGAAAKPRILIFDSKYISENIFDGERLAETHKANLHRVVVGTEGKRLADEVDAIGRNIRRIDADIANKRQEYGRSVLRFLPLEEFIDLTEDLEIDDKIAKLSNQLRFAKLPGQAPLPIIEFPFDNLKKIFSNNPLATHELAKARVLDHIQSHWTDKAGRKEFIQEGLILAGDTCPFCGQALAGVADLIDAYKQYFDEAYSKWESDIRLWAGKFRGWNLALGLSQVERSTKEWSVFLPDECRVVQKWLEEKRPELLRNKESFDNECGAKTDSLEHTVQFDSFDQIESGLFELRGIIENLNERIDGYKTGIEGIGVDEIERQLAQAQAIKARREEPWATFCDEYRTLVTTRTGLAQAQTEKLRELEEYSSRAFLAHQEKINQILEYVRADFRVANLSEKTDRRRAEAVFCGFDLTFFGNHTIAIEAENDESPDFHNSLSHGDKNLLAFAFFISTISQDPDISNTILVIDDPISSFDSERKQGTVSILGRLTDAAGRPPQSIDCAHA